VVAVFSRHQQLEDKDMRKPKDYGAELKALEDKARELKARKVRELGELGEHARDVWTEKGKQAFEGERDKG
jgi:hypothetical protein